MKIAATADFHGELPEVPECDLLLIAGDFWPAGFPQASWVKMHRWLESLPVPRDRIVAVAGNHDFIAQEYRVLVETLPWIYLEDESVTIDGLKIHGSPWTPTFLNWAFMQDDPDLKAHWGRIPDDVDVLMTHGPARGILDKAWGGDVGSLTLRQELATGRLSRLKLHVFGHIHEQAGEREVVDGVLHANVGHLGKNPPMIFDLEGEEDGQGSEAGREEPAEATPVQAEAAATDREGAEEA